MEPPVPDDNHQICRWMECAEPAAKSGLCAKHSRQVLMAAMIVPLASNKPLKDIALKVMATLGTGVACSALYDAIKYAFNGSFFSPPPFVAAAAALSESPSEEAFWALVDNLAKDDSLARQVSFWLEQSLKSQDDAHA